MNESSHSTSVAKQEANFLPTHIFATCFYLLLPFLFVLQDVSYCQSEILAITRKLRVRRGPQYIELIISGLLDKLYLVFQRQNTKKSTHILNNCCVSHTGSYSSLMKPFEVCVTIYNLPKQHQKLPD